MHTGDRAPLLESRSFGSQPTYYLFIRTARVVRDMTESITRIRGTGLPQAPSELCFHSFRFGHSIALFLPLHPLLSPRVSLSLPFGPALSPLSFFLPLSPPLFALRALPSSFFKLTHPLSSFLELQRLLSFYRVVSPSPFPLFLSPSVPLPFSLLCNQNNNNLLRLLINLSDNRLPTAMRRYQPFSDLPAAFLRGIGG